MKTYMTRRNRNILNICLALASASGLIATAVLPGSAYSSMLIILFTCATTALTTNILLRSNIINQCAAKLRVWILNLRKNPESSTADRFLTHELRSEGLNPVETEFGLSFSYKGETFLSVGLDNPVISVVYPNIIIDEPTNWNRLVRIVNKVNSETSTVKIIATKLDTDQRITAYAVADFLYDSESSGNGMFELVCQQLFIAGERLRYRMMMIAEEDHPEFIDDTQIGISLN